MMRPIRMAKILVIEDESDLQEVLRYNLQAAGHAVTTTGLGEKGLALARSIVPDLILLDLMLPDVAGTEVCRQLRQDARTRELPIVMLTAKIEEIDRVVGFEVGADDYVTKPFSVRELVLRVQAILKRAAGGSRSELVRLELGKLRVDAEAHRVWVEEAEVELTALEFKLLVVLAGRAERVQSRESLLTEVWGVSRDSVTRTIDTHVKRLREKLGGAADYIETVRGVGYRFSLSGQGDRA